MNREDVAMDVTVQNVEILRGRLEQAEEHVSALIANIERNTCTHEETRRGGAIPETTHKFDCDGPDVIVSGCRFVGRNADGSNPMTLERSADGIHKLKSFRLEDWTCYGPLQDEQAECAQGEREVKPCE